MSILKNKFVVTLFALILVVSTKTQVSLAAVATPPLTKCFIRVDNPHLSKSIKILRGFEAVKVNAVSICNKPMRNLKFTVEIRKKGLIRNHKVATETIKIPGWIATNKKIENKATWVKCENRKASRYFGVAYAEAIIDEKKMRTLPVTTEKTISLPCGT